MTLFKGLCAFPITPADQGGRVDAAALRGLVRRLTGAQVDSIGLLGSTGSYPYLTRHERRRAIEAAVEELGGATPLMVGVGALRTDDAVAHARDAEAAGADAVLLAPMSYTPLNEEEGFVHFAAVAKATRLPLCVYNNPGTTHFSFSPALIARLSQIDSVLAVKNPAGPDGVEADLKALREQVPRAFSLGYAADWNATEALISGADAWYSVLAGLFPGACLPIVRAAQQGQMSEARRLNARLSPVWDLFAAFTSLRTVYAAANILKLCATQPPRPVLPLDEAAVRQVRTVLEDLELA